MVVIHATMSYLRVRLGVLDEVENDPRRLLRPAALASGRHKGVLVLVARHLRGLAREYKGREREREWSAKTT